MRLDVGTALASGGAWSDALPLLEDGLREVDPSAAEVSETACDAWADAAAVVGLAAYADRYREAAAGCSTPGRCSSRPWAWSCRWSWPTPRAAGPMPRASAPPCARSRRGAGRFPQYEVGAEMRIAARRGDREAFDRLEAELLRVAPGAGLDILLANAQGLRATLHVALGEHDWPSPCCARASPPRPRDARDHDRPLGGRDARRRISHAPGGRTRRRGSRPTWSPACPCSRRRSPTPYVERLLAHTTPDDEVDAHFRAASAWNETGMHAFEAARTRLEHAQWLRRRRRRSDAVDQLGPALAAFEQMGCLPWAALCREELRRPAST